MGFCVVFTRVHGVLTPVVPWPQATWFQFRNELGLDAWIQD